MKGSGFLLSAHGFATAVVLLCAGSSSRALGAKLAPLPTATAIANAAGSSSVAERKPAKSIKADEVMDMPPEVVDGKSTEELKKMLLVLHQEAKQMKQKIEEASGSGSGGRKASPSLIVEFAEPRHQQRPSMIAQSLEQIK